MALFKSKAERRIERTVQIQRVLGMFAKQIRKLQKQEEGYITSAREAMLKSAPAQLQLAKKALKATMVQRRRLDQQMLTLKLASQMKDQAETHAEFAKALTSTSRAISETFRDIDLTKAEKEFHKAMAQANSIEERVDCFLESASTGVFGEAVGADDLVSDSEIDELLEGDAARSMDGEIASELEAIEKELGSPASEGEEGR